MCVSALLLWHLNKLAGWLVPWSVLLPWPVTQLTRPLPAAAFTRGRYKAASNPRLVPDNTYTLNLDGANFQSE